MEIFQLQILAIACFTAIACVLPGVFLVLRGVALMSDAISHAILLGIAVMFLFVQRLESPLLIFGAVLAGIFTVFCTEALISLRSLKKDAAIGIVFPLLFSIGVILISRYARNVHLDTDMILLGEIAFAPFNRLIVFDWDLGPYALWLLSGIVVVNSFFIAVFYKELKLVTFDPDLARVLGFSPLILYYCLMTLTSITAVAAFDIVGSIVVVALMITPAATAYLLTNKLSVMLWLSGGFGLLSAVLGYSVAHLADVSIAGCIATMSGVLFLVALLAAPEKGIVARLIVHRFNKLLVSKKMLCYYLAECEGALKNNVCTVEHIGIVFGWKENMLDSLIKNAKDTGLIDTVGKNIILTEKGYGYITKSNENK